MPTETTDTSVKPERPLWLDSTQMSARPGHVPSLDGLRAISVGIVLLSHFVNPTLFPGGLGVYVFFVISGFLITRLLFAEAKKTGAVSLKFFYIRRLVRLYPVISLYTVTIVLFLLIQKKPFNPIEPLSALFYFSNYLYAHNSSETAPFIIFWSLSVEEHFYLILPPLFILLKSPKSLGWAMVAAIIGCLLIRVAYAWYEPSLLYTRHFYYHTETRLDSLAFGVGIACLCELQRGRSFLQMLANPICFVASLIGIVICLLVRDPYFREVPRYSLLGICIALSFCYILFKPSILLPFLNSRAMVVIGTLSYSIYVWHVGLDTFTFGIFRHLPKYISVPCLLILTGALATASYFGLERPLVRLRQRLQSLAATPDLAAGATHAPSGG